MLAFADAIWYHSRRFLFGDIAQLVERLNGIEKVRGSTPLISTIKIVCKIRVFCNYGQQMNPPEDGVIGVLQHFTTLQGSPKGRKCAHIHETQASRVGF